MSKNFSRALNPEVVQFFSTWGTEVQKLPSYIYNKVENRMVDYLVFTLIANITCQLLHLSSSNYKATSTRRTQTRGPHAALRKSYSPLKLHVISISAFSNTHVSCIYLEYRFHTFFLTPSFLLFLTHEGFPSWIIFLDHNCCSINIVELENVLNSILRN